MHDGSAFSMEPRIRTAFALGLVEGILLILFGACVTFDSSVHPVYAADGGSNDAVFNRFYSSECYLTALCTHWQRQVNGAL